jgi:putative ABC transport system permease protein
LRASNVRYIYEGRLEERGVLLQEAFAVLGISVGVALLFASQISSTSLTRAVAQLNSQLVGSAQVQLDARGPAGFSERLLGEVRGIPGVQVALPILERQVNAIGTRGRERSVDLIGVEPKAVRASGPLLRRFSARQLAAQHAIALPSPLAHEIGSGPLEPVRLQIGATFTETLVGATLSEEGIGELVHSPIAVTTINYAQQLEAAPGRISRIFVRFAQDRSGSARNALARLAAAWNANLRPGKFDAELFRVAVAPESKSEELFSGISALVGFMFALNAMLITVPSRRNLIENIRAHGGTPLMAIEVLLLDAFVLGIVACAIGLALGDVLSVLVFKASPGYLAYAFPVGNNRIVTWQSVALAVAAGMGAAVAGVLWPLRSILARRAEPDTDPEEHRGGRLPVRLALGVGCLAVTTITLVAYPAEAVVGNITLVLGLLCLLPFLFDVGVGLFGRLSVALDGIGTALAIDQLQSPLIRVRSLAIAATAAIAVFAVVEFGGTQTNLQRGLDASIRGMDSSTQLWVTPRGSSSLQTTVSFASLDASKLAAVPGVTHLGVYRGSFLDWGQRRLWVIAPPASVQYPIPPGELLAGGSPALASARVRGGGWVALSQSLAEEHHLHVGEAFTLPTPRSVTVRVAGLTTNLGWPPGAMILSSDEYARAWGTGEPSAYELQTAPGAPPATVAGLARLALGAGSGLQVETAHERERRHYAAAVQGLSRLTQIRVIVLIAATLAIVCAMAAMLWQRRDSVAANKCHGYREGVLWRALLCESAVLLIVGCVIGAVFGLYAQLLGSHFLSTVTGFPVLFGIEGIAAVTSCALVTVIAVAMLSIPGYFVVRVSPGTIGPAY